MRTPIAALVAALAILAIPTAASAQLSLPGNAVTAKNVDFITNFAEQHDSAGARRVGDYFYITTERDLTIYDISKPEAPKQVGKLTFPATDLQGYYFSEEDPDTNGKILITSNEGAIEVIDVSDKTAPAFLSKLPASTGFGAQHTISCVLDCTYAYGSAGTIIDLRDPKNPKPVGNWATGKGLKSTHDVTEVSPGMILTSSQPMLLLDGRTDPAHPVEVARIARSDNRFNHANLWPHQMRDDIVLVGGESSGPQCASDAAAAFQTYDASNWMQTGTFKPLGEFRLATGLLTDGRMPDSSYCVHWFTPHPTYRNGGVVAISWYEHGTRFLQVGRDGSITEIGWFTPLGTTASAAYWITDKIVYIADYIRGFDVVRYTGEIRSLESLRRRLRRMLTITGPDELKAKVGEELGVSDWHDVTQEAINAFAEATEDFQWIHVDPERAKETPFGGTIAHGLYTLSLGPKFSYAMFTMEGFTFGVNYGYDKVRFPAPVPVGSRVRMRATLASVDEVPGGLQIKITQTYEVEGGEKPVCVAESLSRVFGG